MIIQIDINIQSIISDLFNIHQTKTSMGESSDNQVSCFNTLKTEISKSLYALQFVRTESIKFLVCSDLVIALSFLNKNVRLAIDNGMTNLSEILAYKKLKRISIRF